MLCLCRLLTTFWNHWDQRRMMHARNTETPYGMTTYQWMRLYILEIFSVVFNKEKEYSSFEEWYCHWTPNINYSMKIWIRLIQINLLLSVFHARCFISITIRYYILTRGRSLFPCPEFGTTRITEGNMSYVCCRRVGAYSAFATRAVDSLAAGWGWV